MALKHKSDIASRFSKAAPKYNDFACIQETLAEKALNLYEASEGKTLDIGCATGKHTIKLGRKVVGLDLAIGMINQAQSTHGKKAEWVNGDMDNLPFPANSFAHVFSSMALQWSDSPQVVMQQIHKVLIPKGDATLLIPVRGSFHQLVSAYEQIGQSARLNPLPLESEWLQAAENAGFKVTHAEVVVEADTFPDLLRLLSSISKIGAASTEQAQNQPLTRAALKQLSSAFQLNEQGMFTLDYRCLLVKLEK